MALDLSAILPLKAYHCRPKKHEVIAFILDVRKELAGVSPPQKVLTDDSGLQGSNAGFSKLMNRLLGVHVDMQRKIFDYFTALQASMALGYAPFPHVVNAKLHPDAEACALPKHAQFSSVWLQLKAGHLR